MNKIAIPKMPRWKYVRGTWKRNTVILLVAGLVVFWYAIDHEKNTVSLQSSSVDQARDETEIKSAIYTGDEYLVTRVIDGDTIVLDNGETVRYIGIDAPELTHKPPDCYAQKALEKNRELVENQSVRMTKDRRDKDRYGRLLRYVYIGENFVNRALIEEGFARAFTVPPDTTNEAEFLLAEQVAREARRGLWGNCDPARLSIWERATGERAETAEYLATNSQPTLEDSPECFCDENFYDCRDFAGQAEAQALYDCCRVKTGRDIHLIDGDANGRACELLK